MNNIKITGEAVSADGEAPAIFLTELNKWIRVWHFATSLLQGAHSMYLS